jgi:small subunit ribosomal protein S6
MKNYEMMLVLKSLLPDDVRKAMHKDLMKMIEDKGGEIQDVDVWGKRYLAYKIAGHNEGYYILYSFKIDSSEIQEIRRLLDLKQEVLRYLLVENDHPEMIGKNIKKKKFDN